MKMKKQNFDKFAKDYDNIFNVYKEDINFYKKEALRSKGKVLEIACGTGRVYLELLKSGIDVYGIDISNEMLKVLKEKAEKLNLHPQIYKKNMKNFNLNDKFSLIIVPFRSFLHNLIIEDQIKTLKNIKKHLTKRGRLIINFYYPNPEMIAQTKDKSKKNKSGTFFVNRIDQIIETIGSQSIRFKTSFVYKREFELLLMLAGFKKWKVYGGFNYKPLKNFKQEMVWIIEK